MSKPINLNHVRKAKAKADRTKRADENRVTFGRTKTQKAMDKKRVQKADKHLDGHKREP